MMGKTGAAPIIGLGWYRRQDWERLVQLVPDRDQLHDTYDEWQSEARFAEKSVKREGHVVRRIIVDPDELADWCARRGLQPVAASRAEFVNDKMRQVETPPA